ncbi:MAG: C25 family cysteine peptidase [Candidatus Thorarchaeota archaeon]
MNDRRKERTLRTVRIIAYIVTLALILPSFGLIDSIADSQNREDISNRREETPPSSEPKQTQSVALSDDRVWEDFGGDDNEVRPGEAYMTQSDLTGLTIAAEFYGYFRSNETILGSVYHDISMPGLTSLVEVGKPKLPRLIRIVEIPLDVDVNIDVIEGCVGTITNSPYYIAPAQPPSAPVWNHIEDTPTSVIVDDMYTDNSYYPSSTVEIIGGDGDSPIIMRGRRLLEISFYPIQYNPQLQSLLIHPSFIVKLNYSQPAQLEPPKSSLKSDQFENIFRSFLLNYRTWDRPETGNLVVSGGVVPSQFCVSSNGFSGEAGEYLIIVDDRFQSAANRLAHWKNRTGLLTKVYTSTQIKLSDPVQSAYPGTSDTDPLTSNHLKTFIKYAYENWNPGPMYVLLFGDSDDIPTNYEMLHTDAKYYDESGYIASDSEYFTVDGPDYIADLFYGRISVNSLDEADTVVSKILSYEKAPPSESEFYKNILSTGFFEDFGYETTDTEGNLIFVEAPDGDGEEDIGAQFIESAEDIREYLEDVCDYVVHVNYTANTTSTHTIPTAFQSGPFYGSYSSYLGSYQWLSTEESDAHYSIDNIVANINEGRFLVFHIDHGGSRNMRYLSGRYDKQEGWVFPRFNTSHVPGLTNIELLPLFLNLDCSTGWFDGETDPVLFANNEECLAEELLRSKTGGAISVIASSRISYMEDARALLRGIINAFWPGYIDISSTPISPIYEMGAALHYGKIEDIISWSYSAEQQTTECTFKMYHLFGDPTTQLWTEEPRDLVVEYQSIIATPGSTDQLAVRVKDPDGVYVDHAKVCLQQNTDVYLVGYTNYQGYVVFDLEGHTVGEMNITVTKHNFIPHESWIKVVESSATLTASPNRQNQGQNVIFTLEGFSDGEDIIFTFGTSTVFEYSDPSTVKSFEVPGGVTGPINVVANDTDGNLATTVVYCLPDKFPDPSVRDSRGLANIVISYYDATNALITADPMNLQAGQSYVVNVEVFNLADTSTTNNYALDTHLYLYYHAYGAGLAEQPIGTPHPRVENVVTSKTFGIEWMPADTGSTCIIVKIAQENDANWNNNIARLNAHVERVYSPGNVSFLIGNNETIRSHVFLELRQIGDYSDYWDASIRGHSSCWIEPGDIEFVEFIIDVPDTVYVGESRLFIVNIMKNGAPVDGIIINVTKASAPSNDTPLNPLEALLEWLSNPINQMIIGAFLIVSVICIGVIVKKR